MSTPYHAVSILAVGVLACACGEAERTTETFSGTLVSGASSSHVVAVTSEGEVEATLTSVDPEVVVGFGFGEEASEGACASLASDSSAGPGTVLSVDVEAGSYCVSVYDVGNVVDSLTYGITVTHP